MSTETTVANAVWGIFVPPYLDHLQERKAEYDEQAGQYAELQWPIGFWLRTQRSERVEYLDSFLQWFAEDWKDTYPYENGDQLDDQILYTYAPVKEAIDAEAEAEAKERSAPKVVRAGDALYDVMVADFWGEGEADRAWHDTEVNTRPELKNPLSTFVRLDWDDQDLTLGLYLEAWYDLPDNRHLHENGDVDRDVKHLIDALAKKSQAPIRTAADKWASPGRIVCSWPDLDPTARLVMFVMAAHARDDGSNIWVSQQKIADYIGMSKRTVQRAMDRLEDTKAIKKTAEPRQHKPPTWRLNTGPGAT